MIVLIHSVHPIQKDPLCEVVSSKNLGEHLANFVAEDAGKVDFAGVLLLDCLHSRFQYFQV